MIRKTEIQADCLREDGVVFVNGSTVADLVRIVELVGADLAAYTINPRSGQVVLAPTPFKF